MGICCGVDIIEIGRVKEALETWGEEFLRKVFTQNEISYCEGKQAARYQHYAVRFAAKEAVAKAIGAGLTGNMPWTDIEVARDTNGKPYAILYSKAKDAMAKAGITEIVLSLSHCKDYAVAYAVGYVGEGK